MCLAAWLRNPCRYPAFVGLVLHHYSIESGREQENKKHVRGALPAAENGLGEKTEGTKEHIPSNLPPKKRHPASGRVSFLVELEDPNTNFVCFPKAILVTLYLQ